MVSGNNRVEGSLQAARTAMAFIVALAVAASCTPLSAAWAAPPFRQKTGDQINLLNLEPSKDPAKAKAEYNRGVDYWNAGSRAYNAGNVEGAEAYYRKAGQHWKKACDLGWADGCRGSYGTRKGSSMKHWGER